MNNLKLLLTTIFLLHYHMQKGMQKLLFVETPGKKWHFPCHAVTHGTTSWGQKYFGWMINLRSNWIFTSHYFIEFGTENPWCSISPLMKYILRRMHSFRNINASEHKDKIYKNGRQNSMASLLAKVPFCFYLQTCKSTIY